MLIKNIWKSSFQNLILFTPCRTYKTNFMNLRKIYESDKVSDSFTKKSVLHANFMYNDDDKSIRKSNEANSKTKEHTHQKYKKK